ncbi:isocitrate lyase/PEP mutase family protein [Pelagibius sp.]|uniref:isocitrate lyase/PEP mutase family protein n=1 Tax=Pelagibius sp. TaxID=1931238 RepID=UPI003BAF051C
MNQTEKAETFHRLHVPGDPLVLYNIWDAGTAKAASAAGAKAVATGSWSVAGAQGYGDGEQIPLDLVETLAAGIVASVDLPVSIDFEGGYAVAPDKVVANVARLIACGVVGINFEDQVVGGSGLHDIAAQSDRIAAVRAAAEKAGVNFFINARTDLFLKAKPDAHASHLEEALERGKAYAAAGASGFFVPGLMDEGLIGQITGACSLPVNVMMKSGGPSLESLCSLKVARVSHGPGPFVTAMSRFEAATKEALTG